MFSTGIDQHRERSTLATVTATGERVGEATVVNDRAVLTRYFAQFPGPHQAENRGHRPLVLAPGPAHSPGD